VKIYSLNTKSDFNQQNLCITIGNFDGVHIGHQSVINKLIAESENAKLKTTVMSFTPHPKIFFGKSKKIFSIISKDEKLDILKDMDIDIYIDFEFDMNLLTYQLMILLKK